MATVNHPYSRYDLLGDRAHVGLDPAGALGSWRGKGSFLIAIPDGTRRIDTLRALNALYDHIDGEPTVMIGLGLHRKMNPAELAKLTSFQPIQHDPDCCVPTGSFNGISGFVHPLVLDAEHVLSVGVVELHQYAGFSGGHKGVAVGLGGRETILALHGRDMVTDPRVRLGKLEGNPFREAVDALGAAAGCLLSLLYVPRADRWVFGDPCSALQKAASLCSPWTDVRQLYSSALLKVPLSKGSSLYQASRAATYLALSPHPPVRPGGRLILEAEMPEGLGHEQGFVSALQSSSPPWTEFLRGESPKGAGAQRAVMLALMAKKYKLEIAACHDPSIFKSIGIQARSQKWIPDSDCLIVSDPFNSLPQLAL